MLGVTLTLRGDRGALTLGAVDCVTFREWTLTPQGGNVADLRVSGEAVHAYYGRKQPTALRIHFRAPAGDPSDHGPIRGSKAEPAARPGDDHTWWTWRSFRQIGPGHYHVEGLPEVS